MATLYQVAAANKGIVVGTIKLRILVLVFILNMVMEELTYLL